MDEYESIPGARGALSRSADAIASYGRKLVRVPLPNLTQGQRYTVAQLRAAGFTVDDDGDVFREDDATFDFEAGTWSDATLEGSF